MHITKQRVYLWDFIIMLLLVRSQQTTWTCRAAKPVLFLDSYTGMHTTADIQDGSHGNGSK